MRKIPHRFANYVQQMRVFAGKRVPRCGNAATAGWFNHRSQFSPLLGTDRWPEFDGVLQGILVMRSARTIATWTSVAALVCSILAFSWVGLALLGF
jgi:hypothetical protein